MSRRINPSDASTLLNAIASQALSESQLANVNTSSFASVGEVLAAQPVENVLGALAIVYARTIVAVKPYKAKFSLIQETNGDLYSNRIKKVSVYRKGAKAAGDVNTDTHTQNLFNGAENTSGANAVGSMWEQDKPFVVEFSFSGSEVWDFCQTIYPDQLKQAFNSEADFANFWNALSIAKDNEIEIIKEEFNRATVLNYIGGLYDLTASGTTARNMTSAFNTKFGTQYTSAQLRTTYLREFLAFLVSEIKKDSNHLEEASVANHICPSITRDGVSTTALERHTPKADQKLALYGDLFVEAEALVLPQIFNPEYLSMDNFEKVGFWQSQIDRASVKVTPAIPNMADLSSQTTGNAVELDYVIGLLFDKDACLTNYQFTGAQSTPLEARKNYYNVWYHNHKNAINDFTENGILYYMADAE